jgi:hypothetical protein
VKRSARGYSPAKSENLVERYILEINSHSLQIEGHDVPGRGSGFYGQKFS